MTRDEARAKIFIALDVDHVDKAIGLANKLRGKVGGFKVGLEFIFSLFVTMVSGESLEAARTFGSARKLFALFENSEFLDGKFDDIGNTVAGATTAVCKLEPLMFNVHTTAGRPAMEAARKAVNTFAAANQLKRKPLLFGVTILTNLDEKHLAEIGLKDKDDAENRRLEIVVERALLAQDSGCDGVIASPKEVSAIREACSPDFLICTPAVRLPGADQQDQKNVGTPGGSLAAGASSIVCGREVTQSEDPAAMVERIIDNILESQRQTTTA